MLYIIAGHGAGDPGAVGNGYTEAERVRALASRIKALGGSSVVLCDTSRDWYADGGLNTLYVPAGSELLELHLDSAIPTADGGHLIIKIGFNPDQYDNNLANFIAEMFPGRANKIVYRSNLANVNICASRGISYRLLECCFITNSGDMNKFNKQIDDVARGILSAFGIITGNSTTNTIQKGETTMVCFYRITDKDKNKVYYFDGEKVHPLNHPDERKVLNDIYKANNGKDIPEFFWSTKAPWYTRLKQAIARVE